MDILKLKAEDILAKIDTFLGSTWDLKTFEANRAEDVLVSEAIGLLRSPDSKLSLDQLHNLLNKLLAYYSPAKSAQESYDELRMALRYLNSCASIRLALCIEREIQAMTPHLTYSIEYWRTRKSGNLFSTAIQPVNIAFGLGRLWWVVEKTPVFWFHYFLNRHTYVHPKQELRFNLAILKKIRKINATFIGAINYLWSFSAVESADNLKYLTGRVITIIETYCSRMKTVVTDSLIRLKEQKTNAVDISMHSLKDESEKWIDSKTSAANIETQSTFWRVYQMARESTIVIHDTRAVYKQCRAQPWYTRYWIVNTVSALGSIYLLKTGYIHFKSIISYWNTFKEMAINFTTEHIWEPLVNIYETIRFNNTKVTVMTERSLEESVASLGRMVTDWNYEQHPNMDPQILVSFEEAAKLGDISTIMRAYEREIAHPFKNAVLGDFVRLALIQIQKQKVDLERAMLKMDKLLQQNELNFQLMATVPAVLAIFLVYRVITRDTNPYAITQARLRQLLRQTAILLNRNNDVTQKPKFKLTINDGEQENLPMELDQFGLLLLLVSEMTAHAVLLPYDEQRWFLEDLRELVVEKYELQQRLTTLSRMYGSYSFLGHH